jgi:hypothetical protein
MSLCTGYLSGVFETLGAVSDDLRDFKISPGDLTHRKITDAYVNGTIADELNLFGQCALEDISMLQMREVFMDWAIKNPEKWSQPAVVGALDFVRETWPCNE